MSNFAGWVKRAVEDNRVAESTGRRGHAGRGNAPIRRSAGNRRAHLAPFAELPVRPSPKDRGATMGLTSALNVSLNGLSLNETAIDVIGNNVANAGRPASRRRGRCSRHSWPTRSTPGRPPPPKGPVPPNER